ncbi:MAG: PspC domain-containing protein [Patescibacteria group bacterium]
MNEITRIHLAKTPYDIEVAAKKELEKYIKSLETYTQDADVLTDIEIRITELLAERGVVTNGVISSDDVAAIRKQLGEPHEFADEEGDIALGTQTVNGRRFYRSTDDAVLGGVLSGIAAYFGVNPLWTRLIFVLLLFISFGFASLVYILFWIITPAARTATEKLQLAGKNVTLESIKELNDEDEVSQNKIAPVLQRVLAIIIGTTSLIGAVITFIFTAWLGISAITSNEEFLDMTNGFMGLGDGNAWIVWLVFGIVLFGLLLLTALLSLIAYGFFKRTLTKRMVVSGIIITVLGITSVAATIAIASTQSFRVANETRSMVRETKAHLPKEFTDVTTVNFVANKTDLSDGGYFTSYSSIQYIVDEGPARYELSGLPTTKPSIVIEGATATISLATPESFRNAFVQPVLAVYGPALQSVTADMTHVDYSGLIQDSLTISSDESASITVTGTYALVEVKGKGSVDLSSSSVQKLSVQSEYGLAVRAGTVRELVVTQPDVCPSGTYANNTSVIVEGVTSEKMTYNEEVIPASTHETSCATVVVSSDEDQYSHSL